MSIKRIRSVTRLILRKALILSQDIIHQMRDGEIQLVAASLSFSTILSLIPFLAVILATFQFLGGDNILYTRVENILLIYFKEAGGGEFAQIVRSFIRNIHSGALGVTGAGFLIVTSFRLMHDMEYGIHRVWNHKNSRPLFRRIFFYWFLMMLLPIILAMYAGATTLIRVEFGRGYMPGVGTTFVILTIVLYLVYKFVPDVLVRKKPAFFSALLASLGIIGVHSTFTWVTLKFFRLNKIYGSFAALPLFLLWVLTIWYVILGGVAISASTQRRETLEKDLT